MSKTSKNLEMAFAGESQANRKYLAFADKADKEGFTQAAKLFRAAAAAETIHAHAHLRLMKGIGSTKENLVSALNGETYEFKEMYPAMIKEAQEEDERAVARYFSFANEVEEVHACLYEKALNDTENMPKVEYYVCSVCGHIHEGKPTEACPVCNAKVEAYFLSE
ncbi:rubrerythrin family protein [Desulfobaculum bizertense]|uniref:Rubrerythrin n=1 Tax=Desulfobaculum bizertense DSM 18034 TaxID=1121442 RepID=A0A1T4W7B9_9BACT|nr:rubrerythrin family protein [Desulfobaculum bizertense]UIJ39087.1 rubrerythrin family protein [Desulfobaculum bizertense]SKA73009.1 Rubrerythrin [Desulfobaculum bizertense DSM 18034]